MWLVDFKPVKTEALLFSLKPVEYIPSLNFNDTEIKFVESYKHLGVTFTHNGQWHTHRDNIVKSAYKTVGKLKYTFSRQALNQIYVKGRPCGSVAQLAECSHGKREALGSSPGRATIFSSPVTFGGQCGFVARATSIKMCMSRCSSVVPS